MDITLTTLEKLEEIMYQSLLLYQCLKWFWTEAGKTTAPHQNYVAFVRIWPRYRCVYYRHGKASHPGLGDE